MKNAEQTRSKDKTVSKEITIVHIFKISLYYKMIIGDIIDTSVHYQKRPGLLNSDEAFNNISL